MESIILPLADDFHTHLRQDSLIPTTVKSLSAGGTGVALVMPNLVPPITSTELAISYRQKLIKHDPGILYLMTLYLNPSLTPDEIRKAKKSGIVGVKSYPRGVTTNSDSGIEDYSIYYPVFKAMEEEGLVLNLHGEVPSDSNKDICVLNAEIHFLKHLEKLHRDFPKLKIVLEHATTRQAVEMVKSLGDTVGCTITVHHLYLTVDDWCGSPINYCKPVAKYPLDRDALRNVILEDHPRFFLGSDSAPHSKFAKSKLDKCSAGVFSSHYLLPSLAYVFESFGGLHRLKGFATEKGRKFYGVENLERALAAQLGLEAPSSVEAELSDLYQTVIGGSSGRSKWVKLFKQPNTVADTIKIISEIEQDYGEDKDIAPFLRGVDIGWDFVVESA